MTSNNSSVIASPLISLGDRTAVKSKISGMQALLLTAFCIAMLFGGGTTNYNLAFFIQFLTCTTLIAALLLNKQELKKSYTVGRPESFLAGAILIIISIQLLTAALPQRSRRLSAVQ